ncbi:class I adenylate-forming enzyme family protein [Bacillus hominis]|uniref:class I adenylate-forming enzyme family protein n=1 Tax=Bacillus hominis TaxID=2817478 RepID=UPI0025A195DA|nr:class I adenylate-forming enzyme family protein [Bacillus hominis]MDM5436495.1 class I adenylate-forming enzyme family protein [Bacillus hominis]
MDLIRQNEYQLKVLSDILYYQAKEQPNKVAIIDKDHLYTYKEIFSLSLGLSKQLQKIKPDVKSIGVLCDRSVHYVIAYFATLMAEAMVVPIDKNLTLKEINKTLEYCDSEILIIDDPSLDINTINEGVKVILLKEEDFITYQGEISEYNIVTSTDDTAVLLHTSGSVGNPKRVMLTHKGIISNASSHVLHLELKPEDRALVLLPMHFGYCNTAQMISHLLLGSTLVIMNGIFTPHKLLKLIEKYDITVFTAVPAMLLQIKDFKNYKKYSRSTIRQITYGGAPFPYEKIKDLKSIFPNVNLCETYGLTEAGPRVTAVRPLQTNAIGSVGTAIPGVEIRILCESGEDAKIGEVGQIVVKSPGVMKGYYKRPMETEEILKDTWLYTGDLGYLTKNNELFLAGRLKNVIIRAGVNIYPEEIESYMLNHDAVKAIFVYGVNHPVYGEIPYAKVVVDNPDVTVEDLKNFSQEGLAKYKIPTFEVVDMLPKTYNNKVKRINSGVVNDESINHEFDN